MSWDLERFRIGQQSKYPSENQRRNGWVFTLEKKRLKENVVESAKLQSQKDRGKSAPHCSSCCGSKGTSSGALGAKYLISKKRWLLMPVLYSKPVDCLSLKAVMDAKSIGELKRKMSGLMELPLCSKCTEIITALRDPLRWKQLEPGKMCIPCSFPAIAICIWLLLEMR